MSGASEDKKGEQQGLSALCLSGGGIRSAAFSLGVIQALARHRALAEFNYLSTVSGGGYVGSWLTSRIHRSDRLRVQEELGRSNRPRRERRADSRPSGPAEIGPDRLLQELRRSSRFLTPQSGFWSEDTWQLIGTYLRNLVLNWLVLIPFVMAVIALVRLVAVVLPLVFHRLGWRAREAEVEWYLILALPITVALCFFVGSLLQARRAAKRESSGKSGGEAGSFEFTREWAVELRFAVKWLLLTGTVLKGAEILEGLWVVVLAVGSGLSMAVVSFFAAGAERGPGRAAAVLRFAVPVGMKATGVVFMLAVLAALAAAVDWAVDFLGALMRELATALGSGVPGWLAADSATPWLLLGLMTLGVLVSWRSSTVVEPNNYSLHKVYKQRLIEGFLGAKDIPLCDLEVAKRTSAAPRDDRYTRPDEAQGSPAPGACAAYPNPRWKEARSKLRLFHVLNATLNSRDVSVDRRGLPFTFTPQMHGFWDERHRPHFRDNLETGYLGLGWAMAISGAAANPNLGYFTSPLLRFPMALLNLRLGWWLEHPCAARCAGADDAPRASAGGASRLASPGAAYSIWAAEFLGTMSHGCRCYPDDPGSARGGGSGERRKHRDGKARPSVVNLSDGGHFDNLGLYEMIRRRCRHVIAVDASADPHRRFGDLANAIRRIRIDFGVDIRMNALEPVLTGASPASPGLQIYKGTIVYGNDPNENGTLVYVKPEVSGDESADVLGYRASNPLFPHESTLDQSFSEAQFESYRALGEFTILRAVDFFRADKGIVRTPRLDSPETIVDVLAESAYRFSRGAEWPTLAGGLLFEEHSDERVSFLLVRSSDGKFWVLPKGYIEAGESTEEAARREVEQETGYAAGRWEPFTIDSFERAKRQERVAYFLMDRSAAKETDRRGFEKRPTLEVWLCSSSDGSWELAAIEDGARMPDKGEFPPGQLEILQRAAAEVTRPTLAGGIPYERVSGGRVRFTLVRSSDGRQWILPKGHIKRGESPSEAAIREVAEETGFGRLTPGQLLRDSFEREGRTERVAYYLMDVEKVEWEAARGVEDRERLEVEATRRDSGWKIDPGEHELLPDVVDLLEKAAEMVAARGASEPQGTDAGTRRGDPPG